MKKKKKRKEKKNCQTDENKKRTIQRPSVRKWNATNVSYIDNRYTDDLSVNILLAKFLKREPIY